MAASPFSVDKNRSNVGSGKYFDIFYKNVCGLRTKPIEIFNNAFSSISKLCV
jgi:hypothetical protein